MRKWSERLKGKSVTRIVISTSC